MEDHIVFELETPDQHVRDQKISHFVVSTLMGLAGGALTQGMIEVGSQVTAHHHAHLSPATRIAIFTGGAIAAGAHAILTHNSEDQSTSD